MDAYLIIHESYEETTQVIEILTEDEFKVDCDYCAIYTGQNISMRSVGNYDVSIIAKQNNGGGHKNASGMPCVGVEKVFELFKIKEIEEKALLNKKIQDIELKLIGIKTENKTLKQMIETMSTFTHTHAEE